MRFPGFFASLAVLALSGAALAQNPPPPGPVIELAPEDREPPKKPAQPLVSLGAGRAPEDDLLRSGMAEQRFRAALDALAHTSIGGYGELAVTGLKTEGAPMQWTADARRLVLFVAHSFNKDIRVYTEIELEHVKNAEIEQAFIDYKVLGDYLGLRAGLVLVPMGIINELHEPPIFNGVSRPHVETVIIPSTWRELGAGFFGRPAESLHYELYAMAGLNPLGISSIGFVDAKGGGALSGAKAWSVVGRVEYEPILGLVIGASGYASDAGKNGQFALRDKTPVNVSVPIYGYTLDARLRRGGLEWKVLFAEWHLPDAGALMHAYDTTGAPLFPDATKPVPTRMRGAYVELGYDVLHPFRVSHQLVPFARLETYDTQSAVPAGFTPDRSQSVRELTAGVSYRPIREVVVKADYQLRERQTGAREQQASFGVGFMY